MQFNVVKGPKGGKLLTSSRCKLFRISAESSRYERGLGIKSGPCLFSRAKCSRAACVPIRTVPDSGAWPLSRLRAGCINAARRVQSIPQGLKPQVLCGFGGTAKAVPFQNLICATSSGDSLIREGLLLNPLPQRRPIAPTSIITRSRPDPRSKSETHSQCGVAGGETNCPAWNFPGISKMC